MKMRVDEWFVRHRRRDFGVLGLAGAIDADAAWNVFGFLIGIGLMASTGCWQQTRGSCPRPRRSFPGLTLKIGALESAAAPGRRDGATRRVGRLAARGDRDSRADRFTSNPSGTSMSCSSPPIGWVSWSTPVRLANDPQ